MFENFFSNLSSIISNVLAVVIVIIAINVLCLGILIAKGKITVAYLIIRDQMRLTYWFFRSTISFVINHWAFAFGLILLFFLYIVFYSALPDWAGVYTMQKQLVSLFSSIMISATVVLLAQRKMKWLLRLAPVSTASITTIIAIFLYTENTYLFPSMSMQPFPFGLLALVLIPSIISIALAQKLYWTIKTRHQLNEEYANQEITNNHNPDSDPDNSSNPYENPYKPAHFSKTRGNLGLTKIEKAYGKNRRKHNSNLNSGARSDIEGELMQFLESEKRRTKKNYVKLFPEEQWDEDAEKRMKEEEP